MFILSAKPVHGHTSPLQMESPILTCGHNHFNSQPVVGIHGVMSGANVALDLYGFSPEYAKAKLQQDKPAQTKTIWDIHVFLLLTTDPRSLRKHYLICSYLPLATGLHPCRDCMREETESLAKHPLAPDLIL